jgi:hypothetical protein
MSAACPATLHCQHFWLPGGIHQAGVVQTVGLLEEEAQMSAAMVHPCAWQKGKMSYHMRMHE